MNGSARLRFDTCGKRQNDNHRFCRFTRGTCGSSTVEHAIVVAIIIGAGIAVYQTVGNQAQAVLAGLTHAATGPAQNADTAPQPQDPVVETAKSPAMHLADTIKSTGGAGWLVALTFLIVIGFLIYSRRRRNAEDEEPDESDPLAGLTKKERRCLFKKRQQILNILSNDRLSVMTDEMRVSHVASHKLITVNLTTPLEEIADLIDAKGIRHLLVVDDRGNLAGVISDRDLHERNGLIAASIMTKDPMTVDSNQLVSQVVTAMLHSHISCLPVVDNGKLVGVITSTDLMMTLQCTLRIFGEPAGEIHSMARPEEQTGGPADDDLSPSEMLTTA